VANVLSFIILYFITRPVITNAQITFPYDNGRYYQISIQDNTIVISGTLINVDSIPRGWEPFISMNSPCADLITRAEWDCHNPTQPGYRSLAFTKIIDIVFKDGCAGQLAAWIKGHPELGILRIDSDKNYYVEKVEIWDDCGLPLLKREIRYVNFISPEESVRLYAKIRSSDLRFEFPTTLEGFTNTGAQHKKKFILTMLNTQAGWAEYEIGPFPAAALVDSFGTYGITSVSFSISFRNSPHYNIYIYREHFRLEEFIFKGNIPLEGEPENVVCYPKDTSILTFGVKIKAINNDWLSGCESLSAVVNAAGDAGLENQCINLTGIVNDSIFKMNPVASCYPVMWYEGGPREFDFVFNMAINGGQAIPLHNGAADSIIVYNGFKANRPLAIESLVVHGSKNIFAQRQPALATWLKRIKYEWNMQPSNLAHLVPLDYPGGYGQRLVADAPGIFNLSYTIRDTVSGKTSVSPVRQVVIGPASIQMTSPTAGQKFTFGQESTGACTVQCAATTGNSTFDQDIVWSITPMPTCTLITEPKPPKGPYLKIIFRGLPVNNSEFGPKYVKAKLPQYSLADSEMVKIFYPKDDLNHPFINLNSNPNWFFYWKNGDVIHRMMNVAFDGLINSPGLYDSGKDTVFIGWNSAMLIPSYQINNFPHTFIEAGGIDLCATTISHEQYHQEINNNWRPPNGIWHIRYGPHPMWNPNIPPNLNDIDGDRLPNAYEDSISNALGFFRLNPDSADTYNVDGRFPGHGYRAYGDDELMARYLSDGQSGIDSLDWSHGFYSKQWPENR
jgi:hypothetical protein